MLSVDGFGTEAPADVGAFSHHFMYIFRVFLLATRNNAAQREKTASIAMLFEKIPGNVWIIA